MRIQAITVIEMGRLVIATIFLSNKSYVSGNWQSFMRTTKLRLCRGRGHGVQKGLWEPFPRGKYSIVSALEAEYTFAIREYKNIYSDLEPTTP